MHGEKGACVHAYMHARLLVWLWVNAQTPLSFPFNSHFCCVAFTHRCRRSAPHPHSTRGRRHRRRYCCRTLGLSGHQTHTEVREIHTHTCTHIHRKRQAQMKGRLTICQPTSESITAPLHMCPIHATTQAAAHNKPEEAARLRGITCANPGCCSFALLFFIFGAASANDTEAAAGAGGAGGIADDDDGGAGRED